MTPLKKIQLCLLANSILLSIIISFMFIFASDSKYFRFGPQEDFIVISVPINNYYRYNILLLIIRFVNIIKVIISEIGEPVLVFNVYNPDKKIITDFTQLQLKFYANAMFFISNMRRVFDIMITVTQLDIAFYSVLIEQITSFFTVNMLINEKTFESENIVYDTITKI